jgi:hypothetical protein
MVTAMVTVEEHAKILEEKWRRWFHLAVLVIIAVLSVPYYTKAQPYGPLDYATLPFHEAGHFIFMLFGEYIGVLGGTLVQLGMPLAFALYFIIARKDYFAGGACFFWLFTQVINMSVYMHDARFMILPLFGGGDIHDWNYLFGRWRLLRQSMQIADNFRILGVLGVTASLFTCAFFAISRWREKGEAAGRETGDEGSGH